ncbi:MAG: HmuY family protein, partial [Muribaculaceae bacterium]|nr:HmuY family protein [Muribaculaceae bacterium]
AFCIDTLDVDEPEPEQWDIAVHRYDVRTNGGAACCTEATELTLPLPMANSFTPDVWTTEKIITDMSTMAEGYLTYAPSWYNAVVSEWLDVDTSTMPPLYTPSGKVYVVQMADGRRAALRLADFMNAAGVKGYMTIEYIYPL